MLKEVLRDLAVLAVLGIGLGLHCEPPAGGQAPVAPPCRAELVAILGPFRPTEGRLSSFPYGTYISQQTPVKSGRMLRDLLRRLTREKDSHEKAEALWCSALVKIALNRPAAAVDLLLRALSANPQESPLVYSDLSVAYLRLSESEKNPYYLVLAQSAIDKAYELEPSREEIIFNQALILERLHLQSSGREGWKQYLLVDGKSGWAAEARSHLSHRSRPWEQVRSSIVRETGGKDAARLQAALVGFEQPARLWVESVILPRWAHSELQEGPDSAAFWRRVAVQVSSGLRELTPDRVLFDSVAVLDQSEGERRKALLKAHALYGEAMKFYERRDIRKALPLFEEAERGFRHASSPFEDWAKFFATLCEYKAGKVADSLSSLRELRVRVLARGRPAPTLRGRIDWVEGLILLEGADPGKAYPLFLMASRHFREAREFGHEGAVTSLAATCLDSMGQRFESWRLHHRAVAKVLEGQDASLIPTVYAAAARALLSRGQPETALAFQDEGFSYVRSSVNPVTVTEAFWWRAMVQERLGHYAEAQREIASAIEHSAKIPNEASRQRTLAGLSVLEGVIERFRNPRRSVQLLSSALDLYREANYSFLSLDILRERSKAYLKMGSIEDAADDLTAAVEECEKQRRQILKGQLRVSYLAKSREIFDAAVSLWSDRGDFAGAFELSEQARARTFLDQLACRGAREEESGSCMGRPVSVEEVFGFLPEDTALLQYHVLEDRTIIFVISSGRLFVHEVRAGRSKIEFLVEEFLVGLRSRNADLASLAAEDLFRTLLSPAGRLGQKKLVLIPDESLSRVPFAALRDPDSNHYLAELFTITLAPSASAYQFLHKRAQGQAGRSGVRTLTGLAVAPVVFTQDRLSDLPATEAEASSLVGRSPGSVLLKGGNATVARFLAEANRHDIVHFAGHAIIDYSMPENSRLVFSSAGAQETLSAGEIARMRLSRPRLVVLAACATGAGPLEESEGISQLARAFLMAGASAVVVSSWPIEDHVSSLFWDSFYSHLFDSEDLAESLRQAQIELLSREESEFVNPMAWSGFTLVGNGA